MIDLAKQRIKICSDCEYVKKPVYVCSKCGCLLTAKVMIKTAKCPLNKW